MDQERNGITREGFGIRFAAFCIDALILQISATPFLLAIIKNVFGSFLFVMMIPCTDGQSAASADLAWARAGWYIGVIYLFVILYSLMDVCFAATPGKMLVGLKICRVDGQAADLSQLMKRWAIKYSWLIPYAAAAIFIVGGNDSQVTGTILFWIARVNVLVVVIAFLATLKPETLAIYDSICGTDVYRIPRTTDNDP